MKYILIFFILLTNAFARTIVLPLNKMTPGKLEEQFKNKCLGDKILPECLPMSGVLRSESISLLSWLEDSSHPDNIEVFRLASNSNDERLRSYAMSYLSHTLSYNDKGLIETALDSLLSSDSWLGFIAAKILSASSEDSYKELGDTFLSLQNSSRFENNEEYSDILFDEFLQSTTTFFDNAHFTEEVRFLGMDSPLIKSNSENIEYALGGKGYIVPGSLKANAKEIEQVTGLRPAKGLAEIAPLIEKLTQELMVIAGQMQRGDYSQMQRMIVLQQEMGELTKIQSIWYTSLPAYSQLKNITAFFKMKDGAKDVLEGAIILKEWPFYNGTSVVYLGRID